MIRGNRGQVLMLVAIMLVAFVCFAALGIDTAYIYSVRHELQRCADSGALAGASWVLFDNSTSSPPPGLVEGLASQYAMMDDVAKNVPPLMRTPLTPTEVDVYVYPNHPFDNICLPADNQICVVTSRELPLFFARIWPDFQTLEARYNRRAATAEWRIIPDPPNPDRRIVRLVPNRP